MNENEELTPQEEERISSLVRSAYPTPAPDIAERVVMRIKAEKARRQKRLSAVLRYGSIAACALVVLGAVLVIAPKLGKNAPVMTASDDAVIENCAADTTSEEPKDAPEEEYDIVEEKFTGYCNGEAIAPSVPVKSFFFAAGDEGEQAQPNSVNASAPYSTYDPTAPAVYALFDIDGDGESEFVTVAKSEKNGFSLIITASVRENTKYTGEAFIPECSFGFENSDGGMLLRTRDSVTGEVGYYRIVLDKDTLVLSEIK